METVAGKLVVHMIANAHLDPVWMWKCPDGVDEALATCRTACDLLDEYPTLQITRGEAWVHYQISRIAPQLFKRIAAHVKGGRWHVVNGWWVQPDCNLPGPESFLKQSEIGGRFLEEKLSIKVSVGYNVDSFGHCAMLPTFLRQGGKDAYLFTRPGAQELQLPANLFRWRSPAGDEVLAFRAAGYATGADILSLKGCLEREISLAAPGIGHTICMYGVGDHGGAPTRSQIEWIQSHQNYTPNVELRFSNPRAFFDCVSAGRESLAVVEGELNPHAIGCYTSVRQLKRELRRAESLLLQAEHLAGWGGGLKKPEMLQFQDAWRSLLFNEFHDILCGSSLQSASDEALDELGKVKTFARDFIVLTTRQRNQQLPACPRQRMVVDNPGSRAWKGYLEYDPWLPVRDMYSQYFTLLDGAGGRLKTQNILPEAASHQMRRILLPIDLPPGGRGIYELRRLAVPATTDQSQIKMAADSLQNGLISASCGPHGLQALNFAGQNILGPAGIRIGIFEDETDTWAHGILSFEGAQLAEFAADSPWAITESGPLRGELVNTLQAQDAKARWSIRVLEGQPILRMNLRLHWRGRQKVIKMLIPPGFKPLLRRDGTPGVILPRPLDGREYPLMDSLSLEGAGQCLAVVSPDIYAADVRPDGIIRLTILRPTIYAHEGEYPIPATAAHPDTDQGVHEFEIAFMVSKAFDEIAVLDEAYRMNRAPIISETTFGMPPEQVNNFTIRPMKGRIPYMRDDAWMPEEYLVWASNPEQLALASSSKLYPKWQGERLLTSPGDIKLRLPAPGEGNYRLALAYLAGGVHGGLEILVNQRRVGIIKGHSGKATPGIMVCDTIPSRDHYLDVEIRRTGGDLTALGFIQAVPARLDLGAPAWRVAGPFLFTDAPEWRGTNHDGLLALDTLRFAPELRAGSSPGATGSEEYWQTLPGDSDFIDFHSLTRRGQGSIHYALTHLKSTLRQTVRLSFGTDYWVKIWLNGKVIFGPTFGNGTPFKGQFAADIELVPGWNDLLVKVGGGSTGNGFWMSVPDNDTLEVTPRITVS